MLDIDAIPARPTPACVTEFLKRTQTPGISLAIRDADGDAWAWTAGKACLHDSRDVDRDTVFHLFSGTKLFTATAVVRLAERGALSLDETADRYLDDLGLRHPVKLVQLASHCSGLPETLSALLSFHFPGAPAPSAEAARRRFKTMGGSEPGRRAAYRNVNYAILGEVITKVGGAGYPEMVQREVLQPLGCRGAFAYHDGTLARSATGYMSRWTPMRFALPLFVANTRELYGRPHGSLLELHPFELDVAAIGGLLGTPRDFLTLVDEMLRDEDGVVSASGKRLMLTKLATGAAGIASREGVGVGWKQGLVDGTVFWNHEGGGPGFCSETRVYPESKVGMVAMMNRSQTAGLSRAAHDLCEVIRKEHLT